MILSRVPSGDSGSHIGADLSISSSPRAAPIRRGLPYNGHFMRWLAMGLALLGGSTVVLGCKKSEPEGPCSKAKQEGSLAWIADDYPAALACAHERKVPVVVDLWAPWCHTCLSMQSTVFLDPSFSADRSRFVFVSLDTDRATNAPALTKLSISAWPTFYVLDPDEAVLARFIGSSSVAQFHEFLDAGARAATGGIAGA